MPKTLPKHNENNPRTQLKHHKHIIKAYNQLIYIYIYSAAGVSPRSQFSKTYGDHNFQEQIIKPHI